MMTPVKHVIPAGTDAATLVLFDPESLPEDFDRLGSKQIETLNALSQAGRIYVQPVDDGGYLLHIYVEEPLPESLAPFAKDPKVWSDFPSLRAGFTLPAANVPFG
jgi:hypothetical protein